MPKQAHDTERPATFREAFGTTEYRALFSAALLSWFGDYLARAAVTALVYQRTESVAASAATFATSFLPWILGGPVLAALAERRRYRGVMVTCDIIRMALIALVAAPGMPTWVMIVLLFAVAVANPPAQAAKSALMPLILTGDRLVIGLSLNQSSGQVAQVAGYVTGAALAPFHPRLALLIDAVTFAVSAVLLRFGLRDRPPALAEANRSHLLNETAEGFRLVFGTRVLRSIALIVFAATLFAIVPEGLAAAWAATLVADDDQRGLTQGLIMVANPVGWILGGLLVGRLVRPELRRRMVRVFAVLAPLMLVPALLNPPVLGVVGMAAACGFAVAGMIPATNALYVQALPNGFRARAFGVMQSGIQIVQAFAVLVTGVLADMFALHTVVGAWSVAGVLLVAVASVRWPSEQEFTTAVASATAANERAAAIAATATGTAANERAGTMAAANERTGAMPAPAGRAAAVPTRNAAGPATGITARGVASVANPAGGRRPPAGPPATGPSATGPSATGLPGAGLPATDLPGAGLPGAGLPSGYAQAADDQTASAQAAGAQAPSAQQSGAQQPSAQPGSASAYTGNVYTTNAYTGNAQSASAKATNAPTGGSATGVPSAATGGPAADGVGHDGRAGASPASV